MPRRGVLMLPLTAEFGPLAVAWSVTEVVAWDGHAVRFCSYSRAVATVSGAPVTTDAQCAVGREDGPTVLRTAGSSRCGGREVGPGSRPGCGRPAPGAVQPAWRRRKSRARRMASSWEARPVRAWPSPG